MLNISAPKISSDRGRYERSPGAALRTYDTAGRLECTQPTVGKWKNYHKRENVGENPLVPKWKRKNLIQNIWWLQMDNRPNTYQPNNSDKVQMEQRIQTQGKWSLPHYHRRWKRSLHQTTSEIKHRKSKLNAISEKKHNNNKSAGPKYNQRSTYLPS